MGKICSREYSYLARNRRKGEEFPKEKLKEFVAIKPALQGILKGTLSGKERPK